METFTTALCPSCPAIRMGNEIVKPVTVMMKGVYNRAKKDVDSLRESTRLWNGKDILVYKNGDGVFDHPPAGISTNPDFIVGQVRDPVWDEEKQRIRAIAHFYEDKAPPWLIQAVENNEKLGVSGAFFTEKIAECGIFEDQEYDFVETKFVPNNLAIVDSPACKLPYCGINVNGEDKLSENIVKSASGTVVETEKLLTATEYVGGTPITVNVSYPKLEEKKMVEEDVKGITLELESQKKIVVGKDQVIATKDAEILRLNSELKTATDKLAEIELKSRTDKFLGQFPEVNREKAKTELLPIFLKDASELALNAAKMQALMSTEVAAPKGQGAEFVVVPEVNSEDKEFEKVGVPSVEDMKKRFGL